jgi:hypothetical protein
VQNLLLTKDKKIVVIVHVASGIFVRRPGHQNCRKINSSTISEVIESLDNEVGLEMPIFLFGYSKMRRCISQRSSKRVPTHMLLSLGKGHNVENFVQALGRGTFNGRESVLGANGHDNVTVLLDEQDFIAAQKYVKFFDHFVDRIKAGDKTEDALSRTSGRFPDSTNFFRHSERKIGLRKDFRARLEDMDAFEELEDGDDEVSLGVQGDPLLKAKYATNVLAQRVILAMSNQAERSKKEHISITDTQRMFKKRCHRDPLNLSGDLLKILEGFEKDGIMTKTDQGWHVPDWSAALFLINDDLCD